MASFAEALADRLVYDPNLDQDVLYYDTPLKKQIFVEQGSKVDEFKDPLIKSAGKNGGTLAITKKLMS